MSRVSLKGICDMHVHTNPDLRLRAYNDLELADAAVRVGARALVIKSHLGFTVNRANIAFGRSTEQPAFPAYGEVPDGPFTDIVRHGSLSISCS